MGVHPELSSFDRRSTNLCEARRTMWTWAEPIIVDRAVEVYGRAVHSAGTVMMARKHCGLWRNVLQEQPAAVPAIKEELRRAADSLGLAEDLVDAVDEAILEELVDIVMSRYRSSRNTIKACSLVLMSATSRLGTARLAA